MMFTLLMLGLLIAIAIRQATQGFFSALISAVLATCCATAALGTYEWVASNWVAPFLDPSFSMAVALGVLFGVPFALLQVLFGQVVKRAGLLPAFVDKIGGGSCGFITAMITVGVLALSIQMIPFDNGKILGYARFAVADPDNPSDTPDLAEENNLILKPDRFVVAVASILSDGVFSGQQLFHEHNPNLVKTVGWIAATPEVVSRYAPPGSIRVESTESVQFVYRLTPAASGAPAVYEPIQPIGGHEFWMIRVRLMREARDATSSNFFTLRHFRLVGQPRGEEVYEQFHPIAIQQEDSSQPTNRHVRLVKRGGKFTHQVDTPFSPRDGGDRVEIVFELPIGFKSSFLEYKRGARAEFQLTDKPSDGTVTSATPNPPTVPPAPSQRVAAGNSSAPPVSASNPSTTSRRGRRSRRNSSGQNSGTAKPPVRGSGGNVRTATTVAGKSRFGDDLPFALKSYQQVNAEIAQGKLRSGHLIAEPDSQEGGTSPEVTKFFVPEDKRLLQLGVGRLQARSSLGRALSFATATVQNYFVEDDKGNRHTLVGKYAIVNVKGKKVFEVQYFSGPVGSIGGIGKFNRIDEKKMQSTDPFVLLFLVDPGVHIEYFSTGGAATRRDDLRDENLVAPD